MKKILALALATMMVFSLGACAIADENTGITIFETENIVRVTVFSNYGHGTGCEVPQENLEEITTWLATFKTGSRMYTDTIPPDANTLFVEIEYADGTVIKEGIEVRVIDGYGYYLEYDTPPECLYDFINRTSPIE
jgi:hypothetical protein